MAALGAEVQLVTKDMQERVTASQDRVPDAMGIPMFPHTYNMWYYNNASL